MESQLGTGMIVWGYQCIKVVGEKASAHVKGKKRPLVYWEWLYRRGDFMKVTDSKCE